MRLTAVIPQLRTTSLAESISFYTNVLGAVLEFQYEDFYAGVRLGQHLIHLKFVDAPDPSIAYVRDCDHLTLYIETDDVAAVAMMLREKGVRLVRNVHHTDWATTELVIEDNQGHTLYFGQPDA
jgi:catechol 2,3-dioxygenase-like lactoylglutathione lyase family enzyme